MTGNLEIGVSRGTRSRGLASQADGSGHFGVLGGRGCALWRSQEKRSSSGRGCDGVDSLLTD
jgi:hypothetical protein